MNISKRFLRFISFRFSSLTLSISILFCIKVERIFFSTFPASLGESFWNRWTLSYLLAVYLFRLNKKFYIFPWSIYFSCKSPLLFLFTARLFQETFKLNLELGMKDTEYALELLTFTFVRA